MTIDVDTGTFVTVILAGIAGHAVFVKLTIDGAVSRLAKVIAKEYATKDDLRDDMKLHIETMHRPHECER